jgi:hypothetical protein
MIRGKRKAHNETGATRHDERETEKVKRLGEGAPCEFLGWIELEGIEEGDQGDSCCREVEEETPPPVVAFLREDTAYAERKGLFKV